MTDKIRAAAEEIAGLSLVWRGVMWTEEERAKDLIRMLNEHFGADLERLGLLRTCDQCGLLYDRANGGTCKCGVKDLEENLHVEIGAAIETGRSYEELELRIERLKGLLGQARAEGYSTISIKLEHEITEELKR